MIDKEEIFSRATSLHLLPTTIEKDYVLSWVLAGINAHRELKKILVFKGGTCLKKCFFGEYRFSEDLDFVLKDKKYFDTSFFIKSFNEVCTWVQEQSNIEFFPNLLSFATHISPRENLLVKGKLRYRGPLKHRSSFPKIKIDITANEPLVLKPVQKTIIHDYSDQFSDHGVITSHSFEEIFAEKIRALVDRARPRDLFDVVYLNDQKAYKINKSQIREVLKEKCKNIQINFPDFSSIKNHPEVHLLSTEWENMLGHQISNLQPMNTYFKKLEKLFEWLTI